MSEHVVAKESELSPGERIVTLVKGREVAVFNIEGNYYAHTNWCAHQAGPICHGPVDGTLKPELDEDGDFSMDWDSEEKYISCPWHGFEFDIATGECLSRKQYKLATHPVHVDDGDIVVNL